MSRARSLDGERERPHGSQSSNDPFGLRSVCVRSASVPLPPFLCGKRAGFHDSRPRAVPIPSVARARAHRDPPWTDVRRHPRGSRRHLDPPRSTCRTDPKHRFTACQLVDPTRHIRKHTG